MAERHLILCGGLKATGLPTGWRGVPPLTLAIGNGPADVRRHLGQLTAAMQSGISDLAVDLLDLAAYVFAADQAITRGGTRSFEYAQQWHRHLRFEIPVRCLELWNRPEVLEALRAALGFLTDDTYEFGFRRAVDPPPLEKSLFDGVASENGGEFDEVVLFSGGLDSLCGAVDEILAGQRRVVLVSHRPMNRVYSRQQQLVGEIHARLPRPGLTPLHVAVTVNKGSQLNRDFMQRSRSFLFASVAAVIARLVGRKRIRFYENGVTSLNLPVSPQLLGGRASRTTHPQSLFRFGQLFTLLFGVEFEVQNPYQWSTKTEILQRLRSLGHAGLCARTCSCGHIWGQPEGQPHCGRCSQCVDRRASVIAAGFTDAEDPPARYRSDVFVGECGGSELTYVERYYGSALEVERIESARAFAVRYPEVSHAAPYTGGSTDEAVEAIYKLYRRHAQGVCQAAREVTSGYADELVRQRVPARSLLGAAFGWCRGADAGTPSALPAEANGAASASPFVVDPELFEARLGVVQCPLGNTLEFRLVERLHRARGHYVSVKTLRQDVWDGALVEKNTIQRTVCNVRRKLRQKLSKDITIDGKQPDHYRLLLPSH